MERWRSEELEGNIGPGYIICKRRLMEKDNRKVWILNTSKSLLGGSCDIINLFEIWY